MSCPTKTQDNDIPNDAKLQAELIPSKATSNIKTDYKSSGTPPIPMIPDDDMDDSDDGFPLITSVFSLASDSTDLPKTPEKEKAELTSSKDTSPVVSASGSDSPQLNGGKVSPLPARILAPSMPKGALEAKVGQTRDNAPYYVGKGKLILPKPKPEDKSQNSVPQSTMAFSKMMSINPQNNNNPLHTTKNTANGSKENTGQTIGMLTRSAANKVVLQKSQGGETAGAINAPQYQINTKAPASSTSQVNLASTVQFISVKGTSGQPTLTALAPHTSSGPSSVLSSSSALVKFVQSISPHVPSTTVTPTPATTVASSTPAPLATPVAPSPAGVQVRTTRHVNIAPAPASQQIAPSTPPINAVNTARYVVVPKTAVSTSTMPVTQVISTKTSVNLPRVVMVPKAIGPQGTALPATPVLYLFENQGSSDGKTYRLFIPDRKLVQTPVGAAPSQNTVAIVSTNNGNAAPTQLVRIIPKPVPTTGVNQQSKIPIVTQPLSSPTIVKTTVNNTAPILTTCSTTVAPTEVASPPCVGGATNTSSTADESASAMSVSPASSEEDKSSVESLDTGLSPHEARIQKLKELLRKQEEAVDRLRLKRQQEIEDIRSPSFDGSNSDGAANKTDSPFAVPLPPKKARLEHYRSKLKETNTTTKDGFLPNTDDTQFVKLVGLEKVVDKLKAKRMQELKESQALNSDGNAMLS